MDELANEIIYFGAAVAAVVGALHIVARFEVWRPVALVALALLFYMDAITWHFGKGLESQKIPTIMRLLDTVASVAALGMAGFLHNVHSTRRVVLRCFLCCALTYVLCVMVYWLMLCTNESVEYSDLQRASAIAFNVSDRDDATQSPNGMDIVLTQFPGHALWVYGWRVIVVFGCYLVLVSVALVAASRRTGWLWANGERAWKLTAFLSVLASLLYFVIGILLTRPMGIGLWLVFAACLAVIPLSAMMIWKFHETEKRVGHAEVASHVEAGDASNSDATPGSVLRERAMRRVLELHVTGLSVRRIAKRTGLRRKVVQELIHRAS